MAVLQLSTEAYANQSTRGRRRRATRRWFLLPFTPFGITDMRRSVESIKERRITIILNEGAHQYQCTNGQSTRVRRRSMNPILLPVLSNPQIICPAKARQMNRIGHTTENTQFAGCPFTRGYIHRAIDPPRYMRNDAIVTLNIGTQYTIFLSREKMSITISFGPSSTLSESKKRLQDQSFSPTFIVDLINEINKLRTNPAGYASLLDQYDYYPASEIQETKSFLQRQRPCTSLLRANPLLNEMAQALISIQSRTGETGHGNLRERLRLANIPTLSGSYAFAENISYGFSNPQDIVVAWVIDYNVPGKGHRDNLFRCDLDQIGIGYGTHPTYRSMVVNEYGRGFASTR